MNLLILPDRLPRVTKGFMKPLSAQESFAGLSRIKLYLALSRTPHGVLDMATPALAAKRLPESSAGQGRSCTPDAASFSADTPHDNPNGAVSSASAGKTETVSKEIRRTSGQVRERMIVALH